VVMHKSVAKGTRTTELGYFLMVCMSVELNPLVKEIWCYKDHKGNLLVFAGRDGFLTKAQRDPRYAGIRSCEVRDGETFEMDVANGTVKHMKDPTSKGRILGAYAFAFRKDGEPTLEWADFSTYNKGSNTWRTHPAEMIKKVAETHALKKAFGINGVQSEYDFQVDTNTNTVLAIDTGLDDVNEKEEITGKLENCKTREELTDLWNILDTKITSKPEIRNMFSNHLKKIESDGNKK